MRDKMIHVRILLAILVLLGFQIATTAQTKTAKRTGGMLLAVQAWTFTRYTAIEAIEKTAQAGGTNIELFPGQDLGNNYPGIKIGPDMGDEATKILQSHLTKNNVNVVAFGVTQIQNQENQARKLFSWAKTLGIGIIQTESTEALDTIEKMVKEFDIKVGFHNHPKTADPNYKVWDPAFVRDLVKKRDKRIGACADTGHWVRSGIKPVDALKILKGRIVSSHLKDLHAFSPQGHDVPFGSGVSDVPAILAELRRQGFRGSLSVEYESNWESSIPEVAQCLGFVRGYFSPKR